MNKETWMEKVREALCKRLGTGYQLEPESRGAEIVIRIEKDGDLTGIAVNLSVCEPAWLYCEEKSEKWLTPWKENTGGCTNSSTKMSYQMRTSKM